MSNLELQKKVEQVEQAEEKLTRYRRELAVYKMEVDGNMSQIMDLVENDVYNIYDVIAILESTTIDAINMVLENIERVCQLSKKDERVDAIEAYALLVKCRQKVIDWPQAVFTASASIVDTLDKALSLVSKAKEGV